MSVLGWWRHVTPGAWLDISRRARKMGSDDQGNRYFEEKKPSLEGRKRRYVMYKGLAEPSRIPPNWHSWLHHMSTLPPDQTEHKPHAHAMPHQPNWTGTSKAWRPAGSLFQPGRPSPEADYEEWTPGE